MIESENNVTQNQRFLILSTTTPCSFHKNAFVLPYKRLRVGAPVKETGQVRDRVIYHEKIARKGRRLDSFARPCIVVPSFYTRVESFMNHAFLNKEAGIFFSPSFE